MLIDESRNVNVTFTLRFVRRPDDRQLPDPVWPAPALDDDLLAATLKDPLVVHEVRYRFLRRKTLLVEGEKGEKEEREEKRGAGGVRRLAAFQYRNDPSLAQFVRELRDEARDRRKASRRDGEASEQVVPHSKVCLPSTQEGRHYR